MSTIAPARLVGPWELGERIGGGGQAVVHRGRHVERGTEAAVKVVHPSLWADPGFRVRFRRECEALTALRHPAVVPILDRGESDGRGYLAMALARGGTLAERVAGGPMYAEDAVTLIAAIGSGLDAAHAAGLVHRDVTPGNILLDPEGPWLADFGLARRGDATALTADGVLIGTAGYMAPEVIAGGRASPASDRYALAAVAFEVLTGQPPFRADGAAALMYAHVHRPVPRASSLRKSLPRGVDAALARGLAKDPDDRPPSGVALAASLAQALGVDHGEATAVLVRPRRRRRRRATRRLVVTGLLSATALVGAAGLAVALLPAGDDAPPAVPRAAAPAVVQPTVPGPRGEVEGRRASDADLPGIGAGPDAAAARIAGATVAATPGGWDSLAEVRSALEDDFYWIAPLVDGGRTIGLIAILPTDIVGLGDRWVLMSATSPGQGARAIVIHGTGDDPVQVAAGIARGPEKVIAPPVEP